ncbi:hypothetical protein [Clostridium rectalis]|uniref:hypothetical protein n=1 Tax=Clostridium rectalis TaxID=2040295 RepID=UPI000F6421F0|nr:hypothetical protein [Clostridium rectalis]
MILCISEEFEEIRGELLSRGYKLINSLDNENCDAILCDLKNGGLVKLTDQQSSFKVNGKLIIDIGSKNVDDIEYILNNKMYNSLI